VLLFFFLFFFSLFFGANFYNLAREKIKSYKGIFLGGRGGGKNGSNLSKKYEEKKNEGRHIYLEDSFQQVANNRRNPKFFSLVPSDLQWNLAKVLLRAMIANPPTLFSVINVNTKLMLVPI